MIFYILICVSAIYNKQSKFKSMLTKKKQSKNNRAELIEKQQKEVDCKNKVTETVTETVTENKVVETVAQTKVVEPVAETKVDETDMPKGKGVVFTGSVAVKDSRFN